MSNCAVLANYDRSLLRWEGWSDSSLMTGRQFLQCGAITATSTAQSTQSASGDHSLQSDPTRPAELSSSQTSYHQCMHYGRPFAVYLSTHYACCVLVIPCKHTSMYKLIHVQTGLGSFIFWALCSLPLFIAASVQVLIRNVWLHFWERGNFMKCSAGYSKSWRLFRRRLIGTALLIMQPSESWNNKLLRADLPTYFYPGVFVYLWAFPIAKTIFFYLWFVLFQQQCVGFQHS